MPENPIQVLTELQEEISDATERRNMAQAELKMIAKQIVDKFGKGDPVLILKDLKTRLSVLEKKAEQIANKIRGTLDEG